MEVQLIYLSKRTCSEEEIDSILLKSVEKNKRLGITGFLIYNDDYFLQCLEGDKEKVEELYETIKKDPRHSNIFLISYRIITKRDFPSWSMGKKRVNVADIEFSSYFSDEEKAIFRKILNGNNENKAIDIMKKIIDKI